MADTARCSERTLRRYVSDGLLRGRFVNGEVELSAQEAHYFHSHHTLLLSLRKALRTERDVRLAVLFGSVALGDDGVDSDVDLLAVCRQDDPVGVARLALRLGRAVRKPVHVIQLKDAEQAPSLLADAVTEGRVLVDRDGLWGTLASREAELLATAEREEVRSLARAHKAADEARARLGA